MAAASIMPPPPEGFELEIPAPPEGFELESAIPPPPEGFEIETASASEETKRAAPAGLAVDDVRELVKRKALRGYGPPLTPEEEVTLKKAQGRSMMNALSEGEYKAPVLTPEQQRHVESVVNTPRLDVAEPQSAVETVRRALTPLLGPTERERTEEMVPWGKDEQGNQLYVYKPLGNRFEQEQGLMTPFAKVEPMPAKEGDTALGATGKAVFNTAAGLVNSVLSPAGAMLPVAGAVPTIGRTVGGAFAADMATHIPEQLVQMTEGKTLQEQIEGGLGAATSTLMALAAGGHAAGVKLPPKPSNAGAVAEATTTKPTTALDAPAPAPLAEPAIVERAPVAGEALPGSGAATPQLSLWQKNVAESMRVIPDSVKARVEDLVAQDYTANQIAQQTGLEASTVRQLRIGLGIPERTGLGSPTVNPEFIAWKEARAAKALTETAAPGNRPAVEPPATVLRPPVESAPSSLVETGKIAEEVKPTEVAAPSRLSPADEALVQRASEVIRDEAPKRSAKADWQSILVTRLFEMDMAPGSGARNYAKSGEIVAELKQRGVLDSNAVATGKAASPAPIKPSVETGNAAPATPEVYQPIADALTQEAGELRMKPYRERDVSTPAAEVVDPAVETRIRQAAEELAAKTGFPSVKLADVLEQAGFDAASPESMAQAKGAIMRMAAEDKVELGGGDWSLAAPREKAWAVMDRGELQQNVRVLEAEGAAPVTRASKGAKVPRIEELTATRQKEQIANAEKALADAKSGAEAPNVFTNGFKSKAAMVRDRTAALEKARSLAPEKHVDVWDEIMQATNKKEPIHESVVDALNQKKTSPDVPSTRDQAIDNLTAKGYERRGEVWEFVKEEGGDTAFGSTGGSGPLQPNTASSAPVVPIKPMSEIIRDISKGIEVPIRFGRLTTNRFAGYFKKVQNLIGSKSANDISIVSHEVGHKLDDSFGISKLPALRAEMDKLGDPATPGSRSSWTASKSLKYKHGEGVAEFVRHWLTDPAKAKADAPLTNKYFEAVMDANPDFGDVMRQAREDVQNWRNSPAEARLDSSISVGDNPNKTKYRLPQLTRDLVDDLHMLRLAVDDVKKLSGSELPPSENPYLLSRLMRGSYGMADSFIRNGVADFKTRDVKMGTSFEAAMKPIAGRVNEFRRWVVAKRAQELHAQGRETGLVPADVDFVANKYNADPAFQKAFEDVKKWNDGVLQYAVDSGYVSEKSAAAMRAMNADYVPFHRVFEIGAGESPVQSGGGTGRGLNVGQAGSLKRLTGSARDIVDPLETMIKNAYTIITASEKAAINKAVGDLANRQGMGKWVEEIATPKEAVKVELEKVRKELEAAGADLSTVPDDLVMQFFQNSGKTPFGENVIRVTSRGETKFYRLKSELYEAFNALALDDSSRLIKMLSQPAQVLRAGVTLDPSFGLANIMRDAVGSSVISKYGMLPFEASARGVMAMFKNPKLVAEWAASGGKQSFEASFFDRAKTSAFLREKILKDLTPAERALVVVKSPLTALRYVSELAESATRIGEYERAYNEARKSGMTEGDARRQASFEARDRQDFAKGGAKTKIIRQMAAFWNAGLQGNVAVYNAFKNRPLRSTLQGLAYVTAPTMALMALNWKDEDYWDRPQWERDAFWLIPKGKDNNGKSTFVRIPKPFLIGVAFGMLPERMMQFSMRKDPKAFEDVMTKLRQEVIPNPMPQTAQVIVSDALTGKQGWDFFRDRPVVPDQLAELPAELQWTEQTSLTARKIGEALDMSPMKIDHAIAGTTGGLGRQVVHNVIDRAIGAATGEKPTAINQMPGARFFTTPAGISSQAVEDFYKQLGTLREKKAGAKQTGKAMDSNEDRKRIKMENAAEKMSALRGEAKKAKSADEKQRKYLEIARLAKESLR